ncbi:unnamed protein product [Porites lobata]|uniref:Uncharacterized protein n=1 Tax=Porites lobata TaxID=104759 RepID=A0ABN8QXY2_9CNID|nr:unnamed protein product [Porites lobata]
MSWAFSHRHGKKNPWFVTNNQARTSSSSGKNTRVSIPGNTLPDPVLMFIIRSCFYRHALADVFQVADFFIIWLHPRAGTQPNEEKKAQKGKKRRKSRRSRKLISFIGEGFDICPGQEEYLYENEWTPTEEDFKLFDERKHQCCQGINFSSLNSRTRPSQESCGKESCFFEDGSILYL